MRAKVVTIHPLSTGENSLTPSISTRMIKVIAHMTPFDSVTNSQRYRPAEVDASLRARFKGAEIIWCPVGPLARSSLAAFECIQLCRSNWLSPLNLTPSHDPKPMIEQGRPIRIGRVSRDDFRKWPKGKAKILEAYPSDSRFQIRVLGGVKDISERYRFTAPNNWEIFEFGSLEVSGFLDSVDVFVYAIHEDHLEEFGLVVLEALVAGVPVIASRSLEDTFGSACAYFDDEAEVPALAMSVREQPEVWSLRLADTKKYLRLHGPEAYLERLFS